ncbi:MAG: hypothetical protein ABL895_05015 [Cyclobacteriaceae bacterium]
MVEVFRTNVTDRSQANWIIDRIQNTFQDYKASFDLDDCDRILVVKCATGVQPLLVIDLLHGIDCYAEALPDD